MHIEKIVVDVFWIKLIVLCSTVHMDLCTQVLDFVNVEVQNFCISFDGYMHIEKSVVDVFWIKLIVLCSTVHLMVRLPLKTVHAVYDEQIQVTKSNCTIRKRYKIQHTTLY